LSKVGGDQPIGGPSLPGFKKLRGTGPFQSPWLLCLWLTLNLF